MVIIAMATTSEPKPALSYPEHDKLGPLGAKTSAIQDAAALRGALIRAFEAAAQDARDAVAAIDKGSASAAVHASRKALRRARAVLGLVDGARPRGRPRDARADAARRGGSRHGQPRAGQRRRGDAGDRRDQAAARRE